MSDPYEAIALTQNANVQAFVMLAKCLMNNGALKPGQFQAAIKSTFNEAEADWSRLDYQSLQHLATALDRAEIEDRR
jgi:hypothetical protein